jgi:hypothetical protein
MALFLVLAFWMAFDGQVAEAQSSVMQTMSSTAGVVVPWIKGSMTMKSSITLLLWAILGLAGGMVIDRGWGGGSARHIALTVLVTALAVVLVLRFTHLGSAEEIGLGVSAVLGWCLSLVIHPSAEKILKCRSAPMV